jgi:membrane-associated phospholipid phosphatase
MGQIRASLGGWHDAVARRDWLRQVLLFAAAYLVYEVARWLSTGDEATAIANAQSILDLEARHGVDLEAGIQDGIVALPLMTVLNYVYLAAQLVAVPLALIWTFRYHRNAYLPLRNTVLGTWLLSVPIYALFPVAPPRLANIGLADTVANGVVPLDSNFSTVFYNPLAAVPSLHVGFAFAVGFAVAWSTRRTWLRLLALAWGPLVSVAVIATGNHFLFDVLAGVVVTAAGAGIGFAFLARGEREMAVGARPA